jgi:hypothetical protein
MAPNVRPSVGGRSCPGICRGSESPGVSLGGILLAEAAMLGNQRCPAGRQDVCPQRQARRLPRRSRVQGAHQVLVVLSQEEPNFQSFPTKPERLPPHFPFIQIGYVAVSSRWIMQMLDYERMRPQRHNFAERSPRAFPRAVAARHRLRLRHSHGFAPRSTPSRAGCHRGSHERVG